MKSRCLASIRRCAIAHGKFTAILTIEQQDKDSNQNFVRIEKFGPQFQNCRGQGFCFRRFIIYGHDHAQFSFAVQLPAGKHCRREERISQLFRTFNGYVFHALFENTTRRRCSTLQRKKEAHKRNLYFHLPVAIPCGPSMRIIQNDASYVTLQDIYEKFCEDAGFAREDPIFMMGEKTKAVIRENRKNQGRPVSGNFEHLPSVLLTRCTGQ